ncbi:MAG: carbohydrate kinase family protein [Patescibacteria group bacterium]|nr:carbohydrate kinase family protein [Patescibacteria group bacterium]
MSQKKQKIDLLTIGGGALDITFYSNEGKVIKTSQDLTRQQWLGFEYGAKISIKDSCFTFGGGATNVAVGIQKLGLKTACLVRVGDDGYGQQIIQNLKKQGVKIDWIQKDNKYGSGFSFIVALKQTGEHVAFLYRGANNYLQVTPNVFKKISPSWVFVSSLSGDNWQDILKIIFNPKETYQIAWNPGSRQISAGYKKIKKYLEKTSVLFLNKDEAIELVLSLGVKTREIEKLFKELYIHGSKIVVITDGENGAYAFDGREIYFQSVAKIKAKDTTGAGDALASGFLSQYIQGVNFKKSLQAGTKNSFSVLKQVGAQNGLLTKAELKI